MQSDSQPHSGGEGGHGGTSESMGDTSCRGGLTSLVGNFSF